ncbi:Na(+)/H(+) antiporter subunit E1 [Saliniradius amylolyticus]|uniref:Na(+)/H(+) antiporter subunit E1 n=1 Tax=Saliniradius amylolyticus TaxID=2183582 RepID=A0A2S2E296_9ALTE|nr:Na+/H+ antiporter subunit E [Saliniradius amylolyticus]AWL11380.1 Na(+)/H(+) antiporter subunit E1 [Saliniradius amylolyticus]
MSALATKWFPMPVHSVLLFVVWLMLNNSVAPGHLLLALIFAIAIPRLCAPLYTRQPAIRHPFKLLRYFLMVLADIVVANIQVAVLVVGPLKRLKPAFIAVPLDMTQSLPITMLASSVTMTPGTVSAEVSADRNWLYVHVLNLDVPERQLAETIKQRYEKPLKEIFEC